LKRLIALSLFTLIGLLLLFGSAPEAWAAYPSSATGTYTTTTSGNNVIYTFTGSGSFTPTIPLTVNLLVVAGGGGGGGAVGNITGCEGGGGGAGGFVSQSSVGLTANNVYSVTVGAGGNAGTPSAKGGNGGDSQFGGSYTATGGGGGGSGYLNSSGVNGSNGGSGGGGGRGTGSYQGTAGSGTPGQGNVGAPGTSIGQGGGGGGAGAAGSAQNGGNGTANSISGSFVFYSGGGGAGVLSGNGSPGTGGNGGGGGGSASGNGTAGTANTGGGGGGACNGGSSSGNYNGGAGGSGIVIVSYDFRTCTITATVGANGSISPPGTTTVQYGSSPTYTITPNSGYVVNDVVVDGSSVGVQTTYTFSSVTANHTISVTFVAAPSSATGPYAMSQVGQHVIYTFSGNGTFTPSIGLTADLLVVAGGGGGGGAVGGGSYNEGGGGGGGGFVTQNSLGLAAGNPYTVTVGGGGAAGTSIAIGGNGGDSAFGSYTATGGGGGGSGYNSSPGVNGLNGGSGGGGARYGAAPYFSGTAGNGTTGQGNGGVPGNAGFGGGGGGAGAAGGNQNGGNGAASSITGSSVTYAGGGGAGTFSSYTNSSAGGSGGGGAGFVSTASAGQGTAGTANTGGGGGGGANGSTTTSATGGVGGSGIVIVSYTMKATPTVTTWPSASAITYGAALSASTLSGGSASVAGSFAFTSPSAFPTAAGTYSASVTFTPTDTTDYNPTSSTVNVTVNPKALNYTGISAATKVYDATTTAELSGTASTLTSESLGSGSTTDGRPYTGDTVSFTTTTLTGTFADNNVANGKAVTVSGGVTLTAGGQSADYSVGSPSTPITADITLRTASFARNRNVALRIPISDLWTAATDNGGVGLTFAGVTPPSGATVQYNSSFVLYTPTTVGNNPDSFTYSVSPGGGSGTVNVTIAADSTGTNFNFVSFGVVGDKPTMTVAGVPGRTYKVQVTSDLTGTPTWTDKLTTNAPSGGLFEFTDTSPPSPAFYRAINQ